MKGRKGCYADGGRTRDIGGIKAPAYGQSSKVMELAKGKTTGTKPMDGPEGGAATRRADRPGRKAGGRVNRADGGEVGEGARKVAEDIRDEARSDLRRSMRGMLSGLPTMVGGEAVRALSKGRAGRAAGASISGVGILDSLGSASGGLSDALKKRDLANRIDSGDASFDKGMGPVGAENRKGGGRVKGNK